MLVCFDLDDTLLDHSGTERAAALHLSTHLGARSPYTGEDLARVWRAAAQRHMAAFLQGDISFQEGRRRRVQEVLSTELAAALAKPTSMNSLPSTSRLTRPTGAFLRMWRGASRRFAPISWE